MEKLCCGGKGAMKIARWGISSEGAINGVMNKSKLTENNNNNEYCYIVIE
jgi:hypothetical protein